MEGLVEETEVFMFAGHDTTTSALCFTLGFITENKTITKKCLDEIEMVLGSKTRTGLFVDEFVLQISQQVEINQTGLHTMTCVS